MRTSVGNRSRGWAGSLARPSLLVLAVVLATPAGAQAPPTLTLEEALELARGNNPGYLATRNDETAAAWGVREAYAGFLPQASLSGGMSYEDGGAALFGSFTAADIGFTETPAYYFSRYGAVAVWTLGPQTWFNLSQQRANRKAVVANVGAAETALEAAVKRGYLAVLRHRDFVELRRRQLERAEENVTLAETRSAAGVATPLDAKQARVERGRAQVGLLTARSDYRTSQLRLLERLGLEIAGDVTLTTEFEVFEPHWSLASLQATARRSHPVLRSLEATARAQRAGARTAWSGYLPRLSAQAQLSGFTRQVGNDDFLLAQQVDRFEGRRAACEEFNDLNSRLAAPYEPSDCSRYEMTDSRLDSLRSSVVASNRAFPFDFAQQPLTVSLNVSVPLFTGFTRQRQVAEAEAAADDTDHRLRAERLRLNADLAAAHLRLETAYEAVEIEETSRTLAAEQLVQARERYRVGLDSFIQLTEAETLRTEADQAYLAAVYTFHEALADLEAALGQPLRPGA